MNIFKVHNQIISDYKSYIKSFLFIRDERISEVVDEELEAGRLWPEPLIQFNPTFEKGTSMSKLVDEGVVHQLASCICTDVQIFSMSTIEGDRSGMSLSTLLPLPSPPPTTYTCTRSR